METLHSPYFKRITTNFIKRAIKGKNGFENAYSDLRDIIDDNTGTLDREEGTKILREIVGVNVCFGANKERYNTEIFPGPMAVQINRPSLEKLKEHDYYITEKSDGIRAMLLMLCNNDFPRWVVEDDSSQQFSLIDNCAIECTYQYAKNESSQEYVTLSLSLDDSKNYNSFKFTKRTNKVELTNLNDNSSVVLKRLKGWCFSFLFDRTFEFYLCLEEIIFPTKSTKDLKIKTVDKAILQKVVLLDGEIVFNLHAHRYNYSIYDIITCTSQLGNGELKINSLGRDAMQKRIDAIKNQINEPHYYYYKEILKKESPKCLQLMLKHFYKKEQLLTVLSFITKDPKTGEYVYKGYNRNDGLIFTPNDADKCAVKSGANEYLIKWKWPNKLTSDFLVVPKSKDNLVKDIKQLNENQECNQFYFYYYYKNVPVYYRTFQIQTIPDNILERLQQLEPNTGLIIECGFDAYSKDNPDSYAGEWSLQLIRQDKTTANAFKTIANTLENMIENITVDDLKFYMLPSTHQENVKYNELLKYRKQMSSEYEALLEKWRSYIYFKLNFHKHAAGLQYLISKENQSEWRFHCNIDVGNHHIEDNDYAETYFDPFDGRYKLKRIIKNFDYNACHANNLLYNLQLMAKASTMIRVKYSSYSKSSNQGNSPNNTHQQRNSIGSSGNGNGHHSHPVPTSDYEPQQKKLKDY
ncbi:hypothetical protein ABK040_011934 [Willaertia magna]